MKIKKQHGVTLVELVVVVLIISLFALALSPFVKKARERAYRAACANNLRRIGVALHKYALEHKDAFPAASNLEEFANTLTDPNGLYAEDPSIFVCPNTRHKKGSMGKLKSENIDYMYISSLKADSPPRTPICADRVRGRELSKECNHGPSGVNVLYINGEVKWLAAVPNAEWVKD
jgi:prepilin-type N-terminal cleavage/methylation domain-containing protein